ncbi:MAG: tetratricopeptide repeat protein, partial [Burkholderiaceae bacterium]
NDIIRRKPAFAEGWNKRATLHYLMGDFELSLKDCDEVIKRNPNHFGALSGYGQIYLNLGDLEKALAYFERALAVNPNLPGANITIRQLQQQLQEKQRKST